jgi:hypothetical protein
MKYIQANRTTYDYFLFFSYRYYHAFHGARAVSERAILVPTAERDEAIGLGMTPPLFRGVRGSHVQQPEERRMIQSVANNAAVPASWSASVLKFRARASERGPFRRSTASRDASRCIGPHRSEQRM